MKKLFSAVVFSSFCVIFSILSGCALNPEKITFQPQIDSAKENIGHGKVVAVKVIDERPADSLGGRPSGYGPAADITVENNLTQVVRDAVYQGLKNNGFKPVSSGDGQRVLTLRITGMKYEQRMGLVTNDLYISASISGTAINHGRSYENVYRQTQTINAILTPTTNEDQKNFNLALSNTLNQVFHDGELMQFLAR